MRGYLALYLRWWNIIKDKVDAPLTTFVHDAVLFLVVDLIDVTNRHFLWPAVDHKAHPGVGIYRDVDAVTEVERGMVVGVRLDDAPRF